MNICLFVPICGDVYMYICVYLRTKLCVNNCM